VSISHFKSSELHLFRPTEAWRFMSALSYPSRQTDTDK